MFNKIICCFAFWKTIAFFKKEGVLMVLTLINPAADIALIAIGVSLVLKGIQKKTGVSAFMDEKKAQMNEAKKRMNELMKKTDQKSREELKQLQSEMMQESLAMFQVGMKPMLYSLLIIGPIFLGLGTIYGNTPVNTPFNIPFIAPNGSAYWVWWYIFVSIAFTIVLAIATKAYKKVKAID
jgi:uncharacterized membrane protein (DUF106 family)